DRSTDQHTRDAHHQTADDGVAQATGRHGHGRVFQQNGQIEVGQTTTGQSPEQPDQPEQREQSSDGGQSLTGQLEEPTPEVTQGHAVLPEPSRCASRHSSNRARISTTNVSRNRTSPRYMSDDR